MRDLIRKNPVLFSHTSTPLRVRGLLLPTLRTVFASTTLALVLLVLPLFSFTRVHNAGTSTGVSAGASLRADTRTNAGTALRTLLSPATASAAASDNLNFQARLQTAGGAIVPDGYYNIQFKLYSAASGGSALWTETYAYNSGSGACTGPLGANDCRVRVVNGYVSVYLGSQTAFPGTMPWDQQLYLTMNIGGSVTTGSYPTMGDGEMSPRLKLTAVPYAMQSKQASQLATSGGGFLSTLSIQAPTGGDQVFQIPDQGAAGTYTLLTGSAANASYIQNQTASAQTANLWITGTAKADTSITVGKTTVQGAINLHDGTGYQGTVKLAPQTGNFSFTIPVASANDIFCLQGLNNCGGSGSGVTTVGALDGGTANATGATITATTLYLQSASASYTGLVNTTTQTFAGNKTFNGNIILAAGSSLTVTGGNTASRPGSPTEGTLYYDTTTKQLLVYANGKWQADRSTATKIVAASNSSQAVKDSADYVADGTADEVEINAALTAAAGGKVYLMEGTYTINAAISVPNNTTLSGAGSGTIITIPNSFNADINAITNTTTGGSGTGVVIRDLKLDGNKANQSSNTMNGIYLNGVGSATLVGGKIISVSTNNWRNTGVKIESNTNTTIKDSSAQANNEAISLHSSASTNVTGNITQGNNSGISLYSSSPDNNVTGNITQGNVSGISLWSSSNNNITSNIVQGNTVYGIYANSSSNNTFTGNTVQDNDLGIFLSTSSSFNTVTGNTLQNNASGGIAINNNSLSNTVTGNTSRGNYMGISLANGSNFNTVTGNTVAENTNYGIYLSSAASNTISTNSLNDNGGSSYNEAIYLGASDSNTITSNTITDSSASTNYAIDITSSTSDTNYIANNTLGGGSINDAGTGTIYGGQLNASGNYAIQPAGTIELMKSTNITGSISGTSSLTLGISSNTNGTIVFKNSTNANTATIKSAAQTGSYTITIPILTANDTLCTVGLNNCTGVGANTSLSNLTATNINQPLNTTAGDLTLQTTTSGNINISPAGTINLNSSTSLAAGKTITITGGNTTSRNALTGTEGMLYYDTTTKQLMVYSNGKWQGDRNGAVLVAANNSSDADKAAADYVATGTGDQTQINNALIAADPAGSGRKTGKVYLFAGTYSINASISVPNNTTLAGVGAGTILTIPNTFNANITVITNSAASGSATGIVIQDLKLDGNKSQQGVGTYTMYGIVFNGVGSATLPGGKILNVTANNWYGDGVTSWTSAAIYLSGGLRNTISNIVAQDNTTSGITISGSTYNTITGSDFRGNKYGIQIAANNNTVAGNSSSGNTAIGIYLNTADQNTITGNVAIGNTNTNIYILTSKYNTISGNIARSSSSNDGIGLSSTSTYNIISGNSVMSNAAGGIGVASSSSNNTISDNKIHDNGGNGNNKGIYFTGSGSNTISDNVITDTAATTNNPINIDATSNNNNLSGNVFTSTPGTGTIADLGTGTTYANQARAENSGQITTRVANDTQAFTIQNAAGTNIFAVDTSGNQVVLGNATTAGKINISDGSSHTITLQSATQTGNFTLSLPVLTANDTICTVGLSNCGAGTGVAGGDLSGNYPNPTVAKINNQTVTFTSSVANNMLVYNGSAWVNAASAGDITNTVAGNTNTFAIGTGKVTSTMILDNTIANADISSGSYSNITGVGTLTSLTVSGVTGVTGNTSINTSGSGTTSIGNGSSGTITIGNSATGALSIQSGTSIGISRDAVITTIAGAVQLSGTTNTTIASNFKFAINGTLQSANTGTQYGFQNQLNFDPQGASIGTGIYALNNIAIMSGSALTIPQFVGTNTRIDTTAGFTGTITNGYGVNVNSPVLAGGKIDNYYGVAVGDVSANGGSITGTRNNSQIYIYGNTAAASSGTLNNYGIKINQPSGAGAGTTNNYGFYLTGNGGGSLNYAIYNDSTAANYIQGNTSIGTSSNPNSYALNVSGTTGLTGNTSINTSGGGTTTIGSTAAGAVSITSNAASNFTTNTGALTLQGAGGVNISTTAGATSSAISIITGSASGGASGAITIDTGAGTPATSSGNINIGTANARTILIGNAGALSGFKSNVTIDGNSTYGTAKLSIAGELQSLATTYNYGFSNAVTFNPQGGSLANAYGFVNNPSVTGSYNITTFAGGVFFLNTAAGYSGTITNGYAILVGDTQINGTNKIANYSGIYANGISNNSGNTSGAINNVQINVRNSTASPGAGGTLNNTGVHITLATGDDSAGGGSSVNNRALEITGNGGVGTAATSNFAIYNSSTAANYIAGNVGIGTLSVGTYKLNVQGGDANFTGNIAIGGTIVLTSARVLQNVTADTGILTSGTLPIARGGTNNGGAIGGAGSIIYSDGTKYAYSATTASSGQCLLSGTSGTGQPTWGTCVNSGYANTALSNLASVNIGATALNSTSSNLNLTTTTSGNIVLNSAGTIELQDNTNVTGALAASSTVQGTRLISTIATGTAPLQVTSTTLVTNLNADSLDSQAGSFYQNASNINAGTLDDAYLSTTVFIDRGSALSSVDWNTYATQGSYRVGAASWTGTNQPTSAYGFGTLVVNTSGSSSTQTYYPQNAGSNGGIWTRTKWNASDWTTWQRAWTDGNDGSGSGLNADLLDGQTGSYYQNASNINAGTIADTYLSSNVVLLNSAQTITGAKIFTSVLTLNGGNDLIMQASAGLPTDPGDIVFRNNNGTEQARIYGTSSVLNLSGSASTSADLQIGEGSVTANGVLGVTGNLNVNGDIQGNSKTVARTTDGWLRLNPDNDFASGTYFGTGVLRTDGTLQVGASGAVLNITAAGAFSLNATNFDINTSGVMTVGSINWAGGITTTGDVTASTMYATAFIAQNGVFRNMNGAVRAIQISSYSNSHAMLQINDAAGQIDFYTTYKCQIGNNASMTCTSDSRKKNIIGTATDNLAKIMQIQPTYYTMKNDTSNRLQLGLIAQNVQTQFPTAVVTGDDGYLQLDYGSLVSPLIGAVQEQQAQIDSLKTSVTSLQASNGLVDGGTINGNITINGSLTVSGDITVTQNASFQQNVAIAGELHTADIYVGGHIVTVGVAPLATLGGGVGSVDTLHSVNAPQVTIDGNDTSGTVTITTGANATADKLFDLLFNKPFSAKPRVIFSPANQKSSQLGAYYDVNSVTKDGFSLYAGSTPEAATSYAFTYYVVQ